MRDSAEAAAAVRFVFESGTAVLLVDLTSETLDVVLFDVAAGATPLLIEAARELNAAIDFGGLAAVRTHQRFLVFAVAAASSPSGARPSTRMLPTLHSISGTPAPPLPHPLANSSLPALVLVSAVHGLKNRHCRIRIIIISNRLSLLIETRIAA